MNLGKVNARHTPGDSPPRDYANTLQELSVHKAELEIQNEELRRTEFELATSNERFFELFGLGPVGYVTLSAEGFVRQANLEAARLLGIDPAQLLGRRLSSLLDGRFTDAFHLFRKRVLEGGIKESMHALLRVGSRFVPVRLEAIASRPTAREMRVMQVAIIDMSDLEKARKELEGRTKELAEVRENAHETGQQLRSARKKLQSRASELAESRDRVRESGQQLRQARNDLRASESHMTTVVENAAEGILSLNEAGRILSVNRAAAQMLGRNSRSLIGEPFFSLIDAEDSGNFANWAASILNRPREIQLLRPGQSPLQTYVSVSEIPNSKPLYVLIIRDLSDQRRMQHALREQESLATMGRMAAVVAHEVKNPLTGIAGLLQLLRRQFVDGGREHGMIDDALARIAALRETIQQMLLYARPRELKHQPTPILTLLKETVELFHADAQGRDVIVSLPKSTLVLNLDRDYMREALLNLFLNSAQAMRGEGEIQVEIAHGKEDCWIRIIDSGPGMTPEVLARVFEPFFTTKSQGTGLGLPLVKSIVERHNGEIGIACPKGGGTIVTLKLPRP